MSFKIFISHSVAPRELGIVYAIANKSVEYGASPFIPDRDWNPQDSIPERISSNLKNADYLLAIATTSGFQVDWLNKEIREFPKKSNLLVVADKGVGVAKNIPKIIINRNNLLKTISETSRKLEKFSMDKNTNELITLIAVGGLLFLLIFGTKK